MTFTLKSYASNIKSILMITSQIIIACVMQILKGLITLTCSVHWGLL